MLAREARCSPHIHRARSVDEVHIAISGSAAENHDKRKQERKPTRARGAEALAALVALRSSTAVSRRQARQSFRGEPYGALAGRKTATEPVTAGRLRRMWDSEKIGWVHRKTEPGRDSRDLGEVKREAVRAAGKRAPGWGRARARCARRAPSPRRRGSAQRTCCPCERRPTTTT